jgi:hypothetical protein
MLIQIFLCAALGLCLLLYILVCRKTSCMQCIQSIKQNIETIMNSSKDFTIDFFDRFYYRFFLKPILLKKSFIYISAS